MTKWATQHTPKSAADKALDFLTSKVDALGRENISVYDVLKKLDRMAVRLEILEPENNLSEPTISMFKLGIILNSLERLVAQNTPLEKLVGSPSRDTKEYLDQFPKDLDIIKQGLFKLSSEKFKKLGINRDDVSVAFQELKRAYTHSVVQGAGPAQALGV